MAENINNEVIIQLEEEPKAKRCACKCKCKRSKAEECPVCYEKMTTRTITLKPWSRKVTLKPCKHQFCQRCVNSIVQRLEGGEIFRCPLCRQNVEVKASQPTFLTRIVKWMSNRENIEKTSCHLLLILVVIAIVAYFAYISYFIFVDPRPLVGAQRKLREFFG